MEEITKIVIIKNNNDINIKSRKVRNPGINFLD